MVLDITETTIHVEDWFEQKTVTNSEISLVSRNAVRSYLYLCFLSVVTKQIYKNDNYVLCP